MFHNYLAAALRNLVRNRLYAAINIVGLAVGLTAVLLIALFVRDEFSFDKWIPGHERTYFLSTARPGDRSFDISSGKFAPLLKLDFSEVESYARLADSPAGTRHGEIEGGERFYWADPDLFTVLPIPAVAGDLRSALRSADGVAISRAMARKYFGRDDPIGESLEIDRKNVMKVRAVFADLPSNSHLNFDIVASGLASFSRLTAVDAGRQANPEGFFLNVYTYLRLAPGADIQAIRDAIPAFFARHFPAGAREHGDNIFPLTPIADIHFMPQAVFSMKPRGSGATVYGISAVGVLIMAMAVINFVNLMTARAARRAVEVGVRKTSGAQRLQLVGQFLGEALVYVLLAMSLAVVLGRLLLPPLNAFLQKGITLEFWSDPAVAAGMAAAAVLLSLLAGFYPAFVLSAFLPAAALRAGDFRFRDSGAVRRFLVVFQFSILIGLSVATGVITRQTAFALKENMRLDTDQVLLVLTDCQGAFKDEVVRLPGVSAAVCSDRISLNLFDLGTTVYGAGGKEVDMVRASVTPGFLEFYGFKPAAGRFFADDRAADAFFPKAGDTTPAGRPKAIVINQTAARDLGFASAADAVGQVVGTSSDGGFKSGGGMGPALGPLEIIGVAPDFSRDSVNSLIGPTFYYWDQGGSQILSLKLTGREIPETLDAIDRLWKQVGEPKPISRQFLAENIQTQYLELTRQTQVFAFFAAIAVFIAALGLLGLSAFTVERRTKEIGVRKALGAGRAHILRLLVWEFAKPVLWANALAWPAAYLVMRRWLQGFAYHVTLEPWIFLAASTAALTIAVATVAVHAVLVARAQPVAALRYE
ncbi:MAG: ABC transporter permease [Rhodospirillaceae bacterium]